MAASARVKLPKKYARAHGRRRRKRGFFKKRARQIERLLFLAGVGLVLLLFLKLAVGLILKGPSTPIDLRDVEAMRIPIASLVRLDELSEERGLPFGELLTLYSVENRFFPEKSPGLGADGLEAQFVSSYGRIKNKYSASALRPFVSLLTSITDEVRHFPVAGPPEGGEAPYTYGDSWGAPRGGRVHEGCDILDRDNVRGRLQVVSMTDGVVENFGWNDLGGYYVGITARSGNYYYYAHLDRWADGVEKGAEVAAGELLGYMGDTGYGAEGAAGSFQVHLHVGICPAAKITGKEYWINPYPFLRLEEERKSG